MADKNSQSMPWSNNWRLQNVCSMRLKSSYKYYIFGQSYVTINGMILLQSVVFLCFYFILTGGRVAGCMTGPLMSYKSSLEGLLLSPLLAQRPFHAVVPCARLQALNSIVKI